MTDSVIWLIVPLVLIAIPGWRTIRLVITDGYGTNPPPRSHALTDGQEGVR